MFRIVFRAMFWLALVAAFLPQERLDAARAEASAFAEPILLSAREDIAATPVVRTLSN